MAALTFIEALRDSLHAVMEKDPCAVVLGEDILDPYGGAFKVTKGLSTRFPDRVFTTPISEASIAGVAVGMALRGMHPIAEFMFGDFITLAADQIVNHASKYMGMYSDLTSLPLVLRMAVGGGRGYGPTHSQSLEKLFLGLPNFRILVPSHFVHPGDILTQAVADSSPTLFLENKLLYSEPLKLDDRHGSIRRSVRMDYRGYPVVILENHEAHIDPDVVIIAYGGTSRLLERVLNTMANEEIWIRACLPACVSPLPAKQILESVRGTGRVIVIEEGSTGFGWSAEVSTQIYEAFAGKLDGPVVRLGAADTVIPASKSLEDLVLVSEEKIHSAVLQVMSW